MKNIIAIILVGAFCVTFFTPLALAQSHSSTYNRGYMRGKEAAEEDVNQLVEGLWGALWGGFAVLHAAISNPKLSAGRAMLLQGKSDEYKRGFRKGYVETMNNSVLISRTIGWSSWLVLFLLGSSN